jgi:hypothetical protein
MDENKILDESTFSFLMTKKDGSFKPDRIIISPSPSHPRITTLKIIGTELVSYFSPLFDIDLSSSIDPGVANQIIGAYSVFKITPDLYDSITKNKDLSDMNVVIDSSKQVYGVIKRFLLSNPENFQKTLNEAIAYINTYIKTQLSKYNITDDMFITDAKLALFIIFAGKQKQYESDALSLLIKNQADNKVPEVPKPEVKQKKGFFQSLFEKKEKEPKIDQKTLEKKEKEQEKKEEEEYEKEVKKLEEEIKSSGKHRGILSSVFQQWKEDAFETQKNRERRIKLEKEEAQAKIDIEKQKLELISKKKAIKEKLKNKQNDKLSSDEEQ